MPIRSNIALAHGDPLVCAGLDITLRACTDFEVHNLMNRPADELPRLQAMDVVIADCDSGIELAQTSDIPGLRVLIVTADVSEDSIARAINAGVRGYLLLGSTLESVVQAVRNLARGGSAIDPVAATRMLDSLRTEKLSARELEVLHLVMAGMRDKQISAILGIALGTTKSHVKHVLNKLNARSRTEAAVIVQRRGLLPPELSLRRGVRHDAFSRAMPATMHG